MEKLWNLFLKYKEVILYLIFGGLTTLVNIVAYIVCARIFGLGTLTANAVAISLSIVFAYVTNKIFVFESKTETPEKLLREFFTFIACRLATAVFDMAFMYITVELLKLYDIGMKISSNIVVVILNFVLSKFIIFH